MSSQNSSWQKHRILLVSAASSAAILVLLLHATPTFCIFGCRVENGANSKTGARVLPFSDESAAAASSANENEKFSERLYEAWAKMYSLTKNSVPPTIQSLPGWFGNKRFPMAPHLQDCEALTKTRVDSETRGPNGEPPDWLVGSIDGGDPPWVLTDNPISLDALIHTKCGDGYGSLNCYFFPLVSKACEEHALYLLEKEKGEKYRDPSLAKVKYEWLRSSDRVVLLSRKYAEEWPVKNYWIPKDVGEPWMNDSANLELLGTVYLNNTKKDLKENGYHFQDLEVLRASWWRAQVTRYMLRWPSKKLCHETNRVRHEVYGKIAARKITESLQFEQRTLELSRQLDPMEAELLNNIQIDKSSLEFHSWANEKPFIPRPIVSIHVRQGDKKDEMQFFSFPAFMYLAERLRRHVPDIKWVWLSTEMQSVIDDISKYPDWNFLYTQNERTSTTMKKYEQSIGSHRLVLLSLANLIIAGECDYFIGVLGSNWNRLINELRLTSGKLAAGILALNFDEW